MIRDPSCFLLSCKDSNLKAIVHLTPQVPQGELLAVVSCQKKKGNNIDVVQEFPKLHPLRPSRGTSAESEATERRGWYQQHDRQTAILFPFFMGKRTRKVQGPHLLVKPLRYWLLLVAKLLRSDYASHLTNLV